MKYLLYLGIFCCFCFLNPLWASEKKADVLSVKPSGKPGAYRFSVQVSSPDLGCSRYADWWEVLTEKGKLLYRRILFHSHAGEQPFTRSGGNVNARADEVLIVRAHMDPGGYGGKAQKGTVQKGFKPISLAPDFAPEVEKQSPQKNGCAF